MEKLGFYRDTWAEIDLDAITSNVSSMKTHLGSHVKLIAVVKANAYGHGDVQVAKAAIETGAEQLAVAFLDEAISLRHAGITVPILVMGASRQTDVKIALEYDLALTVFSLKWLKEAVNQEEAKDKRVSIHLKVDTGMGRLGIREEQEFKDVLQFIRESTFFNLEGVYTHFATADELDTHYFEEQLHKFTLFVKNIDIEKIMIHCANSATGLRFPENVFNAVRFGISMYGLAPSLEIINQLPFQLKEAFSLHSKLVHVKRIPKGAKVSYGATYVADEDQWIGTLPIGYADGWIRRLRESEVLVDGKRVPIIGRICMDQLMIKLPNEKAIGTKVTLIGSQDKEKITVDEVASRLDTINYEVPCIITSRVPRVFLRNQGVVEVRNELLRGSFK
ncbi:alanine racemase [Metabacillus herbersteinensis]|uniref:Alanine racemase n=1 Tax=Metabacillus herbersteinensis TaxID=283816 RepID=A0ABV6GLR1_9BACI